MCSAIFLSWLGLLGVQFAAQEPIVWTPAAITTTALADAARLPVEDRYHVRYLSLAPLPLVERPERIQVLAGHLNGLSRKVEAKLPAIVPGTQGALLRIDIRSYGWNRRVWERLFPPYQAATLLVSWEGGIWPDDGKEYAAGSFKVKKPAVAPWLGKDAVALAAMLQSQVPITDGRWLLWQTAVQEDRGNTGYYDFLQIKTEADYHKLIRFDAKLAVELEHLRALTFSGVTRQPRRVEVDATVLGRFWHTKDTAAAVDKANPLRVLKRNDLKFDATEQFSPLPNGLPAWWLANSKGERQSKAPDNIVDTKLLHINMRCIDCHFAGKASGILDMSAAGFRSVGSPDYDTLEELLRQYKRDAELQRAISDSRNGYAVAVRTATGGMEIAAYGTAYVAAYNEYEFAKVDLAYAARDWGIDPQVLKAAFRAQGKYLDPVLSIIEDGGAIPIRSWEECQPLVWAALEAVRNKK